MGGETKKARSERLLEAREKQRIRDIINSLPIKPVPDLPVSHRELLSVYLDPDKAKLSQSVRRRIAKAVIRGRVKPKRRLWSSWKHRKKVVREKSRRRGEYNKEYNRALRRTPRGAWKTLMYCAKREGVPFSLTEDEYVNVWMTRPGAWDRRGRRTGCTCLVRIDLGKGWTRRNTAVGIKTGTTDFALLADYVQLAR